MIRPSISELCTYRSELSEEIERLSRHGFESIALWRTKLSDVGSTEARVLLDAAGLRVSSLLWGGGFTGGDGRSFRESVDDVREGIASAVEVGAETLVLHAGCRGGHTIGHARRLLSEALREVAAEAEASGIVLAIKPMHPAATAECGYLDGLAEAVEWLEQLGEPTVGLALDLWHHADDPGIESLLDDLVPRTAVVQVADRRGPVSAECDRLPPGQGTLPLSGIVRGLARRGYRGSLEFECVGETVETLGYEASLARIRMACSAWLGQSVPVVSTR